MVGTSFTPAEDKNADYFTPKSLLYAILWEEGVLLHQERSPRGSRYGAVVKELASHRSGPGSIPRALQWQDKKTQ